LIAYALRLHLAALTATWLCAEARTDAPFNISTPLSLQQQAPLEEDRAAEATLQLALQIG
jgi:hypothetical protein